MNFLKGILGKKKNKKLGLGLGGGGAKGSVHLGVLRAFEEEGISFDLVAGTSIGSIVGGLYARGMTSGEISAIISNTDLTDAKNLLLARLTGEGVDGMLKRVLGQIDFADLNISFTAVAVDLDSGERVDITDGDLVKAMGASSAIAPYFRPVEVGGRRLVDGAYRNITPCDVVKAMGSDFVIGVDLSMGRKSTAKGKALMDELYPNNGLIVCNPTEDGYAAADIMIAPDLTNFSSTSFGSLAEMYDIGYFSAKEQMEQIKSALKNKGFRLSYD